MRIPRSLPNQLTIARLVLAAILFVILHGIGWSQTHQGALADWFRGQASLLLNLGAAIVALASISDILDGQIARAWNLTTDFGRIADPFADKVIVSGAFLFLVPIEGSGVSAWMVVAIVARESLVDGIRGFAESRGIAFGASWWGKAKMVCQSATIGTILVYLADARGNEIWKTVVDVFLGITIFITLYSGLLYVFQARKLLRKGARGDGGDGVPPSSVAEKVASSPKQEAQTSR
ncbi:MAG TPA: CDP-diacylglycerol--glycerol-3-phosphate 3-phosphatidyltransferase [Planctomycetota bacterium]|nr:CDP-diacylglycerol--glycerol-3-phosphate 3-phosphatidyltransferase [Planctomycetota bacterium]